MTCNVFLRKRYILQTQQKKVSEELSRIRIERFSKKNGVGEKALRRMTETPVTLYLLSPLKCRKKSMRKEFVEKTSRGTRRVLYVEKVF